MDQQHFGMIILFIGINPLFQLGQLSIFFCAWRTGKVAVFTSDFYGIFFMHIELSIAHDAGIHMAIDALQPKCMMKIFFFLGEIPSILQYAKCLILRETVTFPKQGFMPTLIVRRNSAGAAVATKAMVVTYSGVHCGMIGYTVDFAIF
jgi:hypothetical protein